MYSFRRLALVLALGVAAAHVSLGQSSSSSSSASAAQDQPSGQPQGQTQQQTAAPSQGQITVQSRLKARREQRRAQAIRDAYSHLYEAYVGGGYLRFTPGKNLQRLTYYAWDTGFARYYNDRLGVTLDARGYYGTAYVGLNFASVTRPSISTYTFMGGPTYRFYMQPKYSIAGRVMGGYALGNFSGDTNGFGSKALGLYEDSGTYAFSGAVLGEYNVTPNIALRLAPEYVGTGFSSSLQNNLGFTAGLVYRFGKQ